jgi:hypothetical protein
MSSKDEIKSKFSALAGVMDERVQRLWAAAEAKNLGWGGVSLVASATGMKRDRIAAGIKELEKLADEPPPHKVSTGIEY